MNEPGVWVAIADRLPTPEGDYEIVNRLLFGFAGSTESHYGWFQRFAPDDPVGKERRWIFGEYSDGDEYCNSDWYRTGFPVTVPSHWMHAPIPPPKNDGEGE